MAAAVSVRIPAGKLGTVRVDRTIDVYPATVTADENDFNNKSPTACLPTMALHRQLSKTAVTASPTPLIIDPSEQYAREEQEPPRSYIPITKWVENTNGNNNNNQLDDEQMSDIAVIYTLVRHTTTRRTSSPKIIVSPIPTNVNNIPRPHVARTYTLEAPLTPIVTHSSKQAQIKTLSSTRIPTSTSAPAASSSYLTTNLTPPVQFSSTRIQTSTSFTSHDRPSIPAVAIKPRPYSFRSAVNPSNELLGTPTSPSSSQSIRSRRSFRTAPRNVIERQISNLTGRVSQLHDSFLARLSDFTSSTSHRQRNRSLTSLHSQAVNASHLNESELRSTQNPPNTRHQRRLIKPRPKSETYDDHHRVNAGKRSCITVVVVVDRCWLLLHERLSRACFSHRQLVQNVIVFRFDSIFSMNKRCR